MSTEKRLKIVPFQPDQYSTGNVLSAEDSTSLEDPQSIGAALSLYFQWPERRHSCATFVKRNPKPFPCTLDYDRDEASPTEIRVFLHDFDTALNVVPGATILVRFEVFKTTYEFATKVTAVSADPALDSWHVVADVPANLKVLRHRKLPRVKVTTEMSERFGPVIWTSSKQGESLELNIFEITLSSVRVACRPPTERMGTISFDRLQLPAEALQSNSGETVFKLKFENQTVFGQYFDFYRRAAFPTLRSRYDLPFKMGIDLYVRSGYLDRFSPSTEDKDKIEIEKTWEALKSSFHQANADYYIVNRDGEATGCSGLAHSAYNDDEAVWTMHQLCAIRDPDLLEQSGILYRWRGEYLAGRPGEHSAAAFFKSKSRWLERIYVKHALNSGGKTILLPMTMCRAQVEAAEKPSTLKFDKINMGKIARVTTRTKKFWACGNPRYLNASRMLDAVISVWNPLPPDELQNIGRELVQAMELKSSSLSFMVDHKTDVTHIGTKLTSDSDRFCKIPKKEMLTFVSSVEHSVAVTERKLQSGGGQ